MSKLYGGKARRHLLCGKDHSALKRMSACSVLLALLSSTELDFTKTVLVSEASGLYWEGHVTRSFIRWEQELRKAFDDLVSEGVIQFTKGKPVQLAEELR